jgi:predicted signal transduction protein with EAL and GGDEF domain
MADHQIRPEGIASPIQLLAAALVFVIVLDGSFLGLAAAIERPTWAAGLLTIAAVVNVPVVLGLVFMLQTRYRRRMLSDREYATLELTVRSTDDARECAKADNRKIFVEGDPDAMALLFKVESDDWMKSTKAMEVPGGCLVQVSTRMGPLGSEASVAEALEFVAGARLVTDAHGRHLMTSADDLR